LQKKYPGINFLVKDPNEDFELPEETVIIDVAAGLEEPRVFNSLDDFQAPPRTTLHDFDWFGHLQLLRKLGRLPSKIKIIGLPPMMSEEKAVDFLISSRKLLFSSS
jgi:Ni,Fe-hydrogenase maturation factor